MTLMPLDTLGVTSTDGVANVLGTLLAVSTTPATLLLEELARTQIRIEVLGRADRELTAAEHYRLDAGPITAGHYRTGLLRTASGLVAAETSLVIVPPADPPARPRRPGRHQHPGRQDPGPARHAAGGPARPVPPRLPGRRRRGRRGRVLRGTRARRGQGRHRHRADHRGLLPADRQLTGHDQPPGFAGYCG